GRAGLRCRPRADRRAGAMALRPGGDPSGTARGQETMERTRRGARAAHVQGLRRRTPEARPNRLHARVEGWEMHASTAFEARERDAIERFCRYALRGPIANGRLTRGPRTLEHLAVELERIHLAAEARLDAERAKMLGGRARRRMPELGGARPQRLAEDLPADHDDRRDRELG